MRRAHEWRLPWKSELPRGTRVRRDRAKGVVHFLYATGEALTTDLGQPHHLTLRQVWAAMPSHGRRHAVRS